MNKKLRFIGVFTIAPVMLALLTACTSPTEKVAQQTKKFMQEYFDSDPERKEWHLQVLDVTAVKQNGNQYQGVAKIAFEGVPHEVAVAITADGEHLVWKTEDGAYLFVLQQMANDERERDRVVSAETWADVDRAKTAVSEYYANTGNPPASCKDLSGCGHGISIEKDGTVVLTLDNSSPPDLVGKQFVIVPLLNANNDIIWHCTSNLDSRYTPISCRDEIGGGSQLPKEPTTKLVSAAPTTIPTASTEVSTQQVSNGANALESAPSQPTETATAVEVKPSFDCAKASTRVEKMICSDPSLAVDDADMAKYYKANLHASGANAPEVVTSQRAFLAVRNACASTECVSQAYEKRRAELAQLGYVH